MTIAQHDPDSPHSDPNQQTLFGGMADEDRLAGKSVFQPDSETALDPSLYQEPIDTIGTLSTTPEKTKGWRKIVAIGALGVGAIAGIVTMTKGGEDETKPIAADTTAPAPSTTTELAEVTSLPERSSENPSLSDDIFNTGEIFPGEATITATRPNGEKIQVPFLRTNPKQDPEAFAASALGLMSCYITTGDDTCLRAFSTDSYVQDGLSEIRDKDVVPAIERHFRNKDIQTVFYGAPEDPPVFKYRIDQDSGREMVYLDTGTLYYWNMIVAGEGSWQSPKTRSDPSELSVSRLEFFLDPAGDISLTVSDLNFVYGLK